MITPKILLVEDSPSLAALYQEYLKKLDLSVLWADTLAKARDFHEKYKPCLILLDLKLPDGDGIDLLMELHEAGSPASIIVVTAHSSVDVALAAIRHGAIDFIEKPFDESRLLVTVKNALAQRALADKLEEYKEQYERDEFYGFVGKSPAMQSVYCILEAAAASVATVFITGESGTGKELCAQALHKISPRRNKPFIALNCAAIPRDLIESEVFGHVKGAFTGASVERQGAALAADGGTLFLDELCEMDLDLQSKLLRFVQTGQVQRVGSNKLYDVDVRIVCATNRDPSKEVEAGRFREDLYYRLHVIPVCLPPLRERDDDVLLLARRMLRQFSSEEKKDFKRFTAETEALMRRYTWPGNVRQLQNVVRHVVVLNQGVEVLPSMLPVPINEGIGGGHHNLFAESGGLSTSAHDQHLIAKIKPLWLVEREAIELAIEYCEGNIPRAAALLEVSPSTIYRKKATWDSEGT